MGTSISTSGKKTTASTSSKAKKPAQASKTAAPAAAKKTIAPAMAKKTAASAPAKKTAGVVATKAPAKLPAKRQSSREAMLARVESVRLAQRSAGHFDCFGRAEQGFCDQGDCAYHAECLSVSGLLRV
ncbi:MAG: hypothetical protein P4L39_10875 [Humidesulfovibrio sp.]|nr:hypothetical protein [Humidesulfovibrio sp.]